MFPFSITDFLLGGLFAMAICSLAYYKKWLTLSGALLAAAIGTLVWYCGGWKTSVPLLFFFVSGSLISRLPKADTPNPVEIEGPRNATQVFCNGGVAALFLLVWLWQQQPIWLAGYLLSLSCSTADTWSSEWGRFFGGKVVDIKNGKPMQAGLSGGISWQGTLAGLTGAACLAVFGLIGFNFEADWLITIALGGFVGMLLDSLLGSFFQAKYLQANGSWREEPTASEYSKPQKGLAWMNNDLVNLLANIIVSAAGVCGLWLMPK